MSAKKNILVHKEMGASIRQSGGFRGLNRYSISLRNGISENTMLKKVNSN
jgi:hypothetical protein